MAIEKTPDIMEEIEQIKEEVQSGKQTIKAKYLVKAYEAILELHQRLSALEANKSE